MLAQKFGNCVWSTVAIASASLLAPEADAQQVGFSAPKGGPAILVAAPHTQAPAAACKRSAVRIIGQLATGVLGAWIGGIGAYHVVYNIDPSGVKVDGDNGYKPNANTAFAIGSWVGSTALVFIAGRPACGSLGRTALGTGIPSAVLLLGRDDGYLALMGVLFIAPLQAAGGTLMFPKR